ncbi:MAG: hypothetical protein LDL31_02770 [Prosthecobacter sp.]|nr:hypothetical protein [Prosthecobacter sp.]
MLATLEDPRLVQENLSRWLLVPVPLHWSRKIVRGFNQSWELCCQLSDRTGIPALQALRRVNRTQRQALLNRKQRLVNMRGVFCLKNAWLPPWRAKARLQGANVLLVDDVLTTGATAHECARVLRTQAGVQKVVVITAVRG